MADRVQEKNYHEEVNDRLELFINYFVKEFEAKLHIYHLILEGEIKKAGKFSDTFSEKLGQGVGGALGGAAGLFLGAPGTGAKLGANAGKETGKKVGDILGNKKNTEKITRLLDLVEISQKDKANSRLKLVRNGFDLFQSFEMQFMRVTTDQGQQKAIQQLAKDAINRAINYLKENGQIGPLSQCCLLGKSKKEEVYSRNPGFDIHYQHVSIKRKWNTANLFEQAGIVLETKNSTSYYRKSAEESATGQYGYRRLLSEENWEGMAENYIRDNIADSQSVEFTDYQYITNPDSMEAQPGQILENLNGEDKNLSEERLRKILEEIRRDVLKEVDLLKKLSEDHSEDFKILLNIEQKLNNLKMDEYTEKLKQYFDEFQQKLELIQNVIVEGIKENRDEHIKTRQNIEVIIQKLDNKNTKSEQILTGLGIIKYYYMSRTLMRCVQIKRDFLEETRKFLVTRSSQIDPSKFQTNQQNIILISDKLRDFETLIRAYKSLNIHWLKEENARFLWLNSHGSLSDLRQFVDNTTQQFIEVEKLSCIKDKVVLISAGPGMGKSTLLTYLSVEQIKLSKSVKVIRLNLNDHTQLLARAEFETALGIIDFLRETSGINDLNELRTCIVLIDGFDEIASSTDYKEKVINLVKFLKDIVNNLWITTRPYAQFHLEDEFGVFAFNLKPLSEHNQQELLQKFWKTGFVYDTVMALTAKIRLENDDGEIRKLIDQISNMISSGIIQLQAADDSLKQIQSLVTEFNIRTKLDSVKLITNLVQKQVDKKLYTVSEQVERLVETLDLELIKNLIHIRAKSYAEQLIVQFSKSVSDQERAFTGVPLQIRMLAEAFQESFYEDFRRLFDLDAEERCADQPRLPPKLNLLDLYRRFIENRYRLNFVEKGDTDLTKEFHKELYENSRKPFVKKHRLLALNLLFTETNLEQILSEKEKTKLEKLKEVIGVGKENTGIIQQIINGKPDFIHRTFAEYFTADYFVALRKKTRFQQLKQFLSEHLFKPEYEVVRHFFDRILMHSKEDQNQFELHEAVLNTDLDKINDALLTLSKTEIDNVDKGGRTALHLAAAYGHYEIVNNLLEHEASISIEDQIFAWHPLTYADQNSFWNIVEVLLQNGGATEDLLEARKNVHVGRTLLHLAAENGYMAFAKVLVEQLDANCRATDPYQRIPMHLAAWNGQIEIVKYLRDIDKEMESIKDFSGKTPLDQAVYGGQLEIVQYLGEKSDLTRNELDEMQLNAAASSGDYKVVKQLLDARVNVNSEVLGWTALHQASMDGSLDVVQLLVEYGAKIDHLGDQHPDPNARDGWTPLHGAANGGRYEIVKYLVEKLIENKEETRINPANHDGYTPFHSAARGGHFLVVKYYLEELKDVEIDINVKDKKGTTALQTAVFHGRHEIVRYLVERNADINAVDKWGATVLFSAFCLNDPEIINFLLDNRAKIDSDESVIGKLGMSVLHVAALYGALPLVRRLIETEKVDVNIGATTFTALHLAAIGGNKEIIRYLLEKGAKVDVTVDFVQITSILNEEGNVLIGTSMETVVTKLSRFSNYLSALMNATPYLIYKILEYADEDTLGLLEPNHGWLKKRMDGLVIYGTQLILAKYFKEQIKKLKVFVSQKSGSGDLYLLEQNMLDPPQETQEDVSGRVLLKEWVWISGVITFLNVYLQKGFDGCLNIFNGFVSIFRRIFGRFEYETNT